MTGGRRRKSALDADDERLWRHVARTVKPLGPGRRAPERGEALTPERPPLKSSRVTISAPAQPPASSTTRREPLEGPANRQWARRMGRGDIAIDARLDLHGMTQAAAHARLMRFLAVATARNLRVVLVITGKGGAGKGEGERGVLRRALPHWLKESGVSDQIVSVSPAHPRHGGAGAYYVVLRRRRG